MYSIYCITYYGNNIRKTIEGKFFIENAFWFYFDSLSETYDFIDKNSLRKF